MSTKVAIKGTYDSLVLKYLICIPSFCFLRSIIFL